MKRVLPNVTWDNFLGEKRLA